MENSYRMSDFQVGSSEIEDSHRPKNNNQLLCPISESQEAEECDYRQAKSLHINENIHSQKASLKSPSLQKNELKYA